MKLNVLLVFAVISNWRQALAEEILALPGLRTQPKFKQYSGYLRASQTHYLHYWFVESQRDPENDPVVTWMNGGPGCSSMEGFLTELGPFWINSDGRTLSENPYSWNKEANVLFIEAPAGVGFSYSTDGNVTTNDDQTSAENYAALQDFFTKFPQFRANDLYITGESYGGIYVPTLAVRVLENFSTFPLKLKGIATGNGMLSFNMNTDTLLEFAYHHGLIGEKIWKTMREACCDGCTDTCNFHQPSSDYCNGTINRILENMFTNGINMYNLYADCAGSNPIQHYRKWLFDMVGLFPRHRHLIRKALARAALNEAKFMDLGTSAGGTLRDEPPCTNDTAITSYLNRSDVRAALFIPNFVQPWVICSDAVEKHYSTIYENMVSQFRQIIGKGVKVLIYHGDVDMACNFLMGQQFTSKLGLPITEQKRAWFAKKQIAGYVTRYNGLDFVTVKGAGHMVPTNKPIQSMKMIQSFINDQPY